MDRELKKELAEFQAEMIRRNAKVCLVPTGDFHLSEYAGEYFKIREFLSGFTGSAGMLLVAEEEALLWIDGRYFVQAKQQLEGSGIRLMKAGEPDVPSVEEYLEKTLKKGQVLAFDGKMLSAAQGRKLEQITNKCEASLLLDQWIDAVWTKRPALEFHSVNRLGLFYTGRRVQEKLESVRASIYREGAKIHIMSALDEIAWLFNLRGSDIPHDPVFFSHAAITMDQAVLFLREGVLTEETTKLLQDEKVEVRAYESFYDYLRQEIRGKNILADPDNLTYLAWSILEKENHMIAGNDPCILLKAVKTTAETENLKQAHEQDGLCMCRFLYWIKEQVKKECSITEMDAAEYLDQLRMSQKNCTDVSFDTIAAYGENAAMCHYSPNKEVLAELKPEGFLLVDSGGQYLTGTTDITRTIALGALTQEQKEHYTLVLQGHIRLAAARFPKGVCGANLDVLARGPLWSRGLDYKHGTGHGVGYYLSVHEGPNSINWNLQKQQVKTAPLKEGMLTSNEPGLYLEGRYGIRLENLILTRAVKEKGMDGFLEFETVTMAPFERDAILPEMLDEKELEWLNAYHRRIFELYASRLSKEERIWLQGVTKPL